jgi:clan AA aspartic protease
MGRVMAKIKLTNNTDLSNAHGGLIEGGAVRTVEIEGLVDTGATMLVLPLDVVERLGLVPEGFRTVKYANGQLAKVPRVTGVRIEILGRDMTCDALVEASGTLALIGQIPLEGLDLVVDPKSRDVTVNPLSPDSPLMDLMMAS